MALGISVVASCGWLEVDGEKIVAGELDDGEGAGFGYRAWVEERRNRGL